MRKSFFRTSIFMSVFTMCLFGCSAGALDSGNAGPFTLIEEGMIDYDYVTETETPHAVMTLDGKPFSFDGKIFVGDTDKELDSLVAGDRISLYQDKKTKEKFVRCEPAIIAHCGIAPTPGSGELVLVVYNTNVYAGTYHYLEYGIAEDMTIRKTPYAFRNVYYASFAEYKNYLGNAYHRLKAMYEYKVSIKNRTYFD